MPNFSTPSRLGRLRLGAGRLGAGSAEIVLPPPGPGPPVNLPIFEDFERGSPVSVPSGSISMGAIFAAVTPPSLVPDLTNTSFSTLDVAAADAAFDPTHTASGTMGARVDLSTGQRWLAGWNVQGSEFFGRVYVLREFPGIASGQAIIRVTGPVASLALAEIGIDGEGILYLNDRNGALAAEADRAIALDLLVRIEYHFDHGLGTAEVRCWFSPQDPGEPTIRLMAAGDFGQPEDVATYWTGAAA